MSRRVRSVGIDGTERRGYSFGVMQRVVQAAGLFMVALALLATGYSAWNYVWLYRWIAQAQLSAFGSYEVQLTFLVTLLGYLVPPLLVILPLRFALGHDGADSGRSIELSHWIENNRGSLVLGIATVGCLGAGAYFALDALSMGERTALDVAVLEAGGEPPSRYVLLSGALRRDRIYSVTEEHSTRVFVPIVRNSPAQPAVFLETHDSWLETYAADLSSGTFEGVLYENGLPGLVRDEFAAAGMVGPRHYTLEYRLTPASRWDVAAVLVVAGALAGLLLGLVRFVTHRRGTR